MSQTDVIPAAALEELVATNHAATMNRAAVSVGSDPDSQKVLASEGRFEVNQDRLEVGELSDSFFPQTHSCGIKFMVRGSVG